MIHETAVPTILLRIARTGDVLACAEIAATARSRSRGLLGRRSLLPSSGMLITPCRMIHTWFMQFSIDAVFLDRSGRGVKICEAVEPFRLVWGGRRAHDTLELAAGEARLHGLRVRDVLERIDAAGPSWSARGDTARR
jgi:uncharacterized membrane protein (UPF0127 family)